MVPNSIGHDPAESQHPVSSLISLLEDDTLELKPAVFPGSHKIDQVLFETEGDKELSVEEAMLACGDDVAYVLDLVTQEQNRSVT